MSRISRHQLLVALSRHIGRENGASVRKLVQEVRGDLLPDAGAERQVRHLVEELRLEGHHVCAHPASGYFLAASEEELLDSCAYLTERAMKSLRQVSAMTKQAIPDLVGQHRLPS